MNISDFVVISVLLPPQKKIILVVTIIGVNVFDAFLHNSDGVTLKGVV